MRRPFWLASSFLLIAAVGGFVWLRFHLVAERRLAAWEERKEAAATRDILERLVTLEGGPMSLGAFAKLIKKESGMEVEFDEASLAITRYPVQPAATIPLLVPKATLSLHSALRLTLQPKNLWAELHGKSLLITRWDSSVERIRLETVVYPLPPTGPTGMDEQAWRDLIAGNLPTWVPPGYLRLATQVQAVPGALVVVHTADGHRRVRQIINAISRLGESKEPHSPITIPPPAPGTLERQILAALDNPTTLECVEQPLNDAVNYLAEQHGIPLILMVPKLVEASVSPDIPMTKNLKNISLRSALRLLLQDLELTFVVRDEALVITTPEDAEDDEVIVAYGVHDLLGDLNPPDWDSFVELLARHVAPHKWNFSGPVPSLGFGNGWLVFSQTWDVHEEVGRLITSLRRILSLPSSTGVVAVVANPESEQKLRAALERPLALDFKNAALRDVILKLQKELQIPIVLAAKKLEEASVSPSTPVTCKLPGAPAKSQLRALLQPLALTYVLRDEVLIITTPEDAESQIMLRLYDVRNLISEELSGKKLCDQLVKDVNPPQWDRWGGPGSASVYRGILAVNATDLIHEDIEKWLAELRAKQAEKPAARENG